MSYNKQKQPAQSLIMAKDYPFFIAVLLIIFSSSNASAIEELKYDTNISFTSRFHINAYIASEYESDPDIYRIAPIDLNNDGNDEFILQRKNCYIEKKVCTHLIIAEKDSEILLLSKIRARTLVAAGTFSHRIKDILAFKNGVNDYDFEIYMWSPSEKTYILKAE